MVLGQTGHKEEKIMLKIRNFEVERSNEQGEFIRAEISVSDASELATTSGN